MSSPTQRSIHSSGSSSSSSSSSESPPASPATPSRPHVHRRRTGRHHRPRHSTTAPAAILHGGVDSPPNYTNQPFQPEQQTIHHGSTSSPLLQRATRPTPGGHGAGFYNISGLNLSNTSLDSNALLDHREQHYMRPRRSSTAQGGGGGGGIAFGSRRFPGTGFGGEERERGAQTEGSGESQREPRDRDRDRDPRVFVTTPGGSVSTGKTKGRGTLRQRRGPTHGTESDESMYDSGDNDENTRLLGPRDRPRVGARQATDGRSIMDMAKASVHGGQNRDTHLLGASVGKNYGSVNFPPSVPTSPRIEPAMYLDGTNPLGERALGGSRAEGIIIDIEALNSGPGAAGAAGASSTTTTPPEGTSLGRQPILLRAEEDVCFPIDECLSDSIHSPSHGAHHDLRTGRRIIREWPDMSVLEEWSREEKEQRSEGIRAKKTSEPVYVGGRLRPNLRTNLWHREEEEAPYRFTYFNDELPATIHSHTISELLLPGQSFAELFRPEPRKYDDEDWAYEEGDSQRPGVEQPPNNSLGGMGMNTAHHGMSGGGSPNHEAEPVSVGVRPTFWLDVLSPTDAEMKVLTKAFGIHPLTAEDIMMQEAREKVELFRSYYLVSYKSFEQDMGSEDYLDPVNIYVVVFREGVISFHFSLTPHPANVRRRIRQLKDYITVSADWISYALIDDITDAFAPLIQSIEDEVDDIDERILHLHVDPEDGGDSKSSAAPVKDKEEGNGGNMLRRVGDCRKKVMGLYRLLGNKADVIKGFAKRCNEQWEVAPRSEIGLYLGDIQDHIVTMVSNLNHYEKILSRSHSNYLAQINIQMNQRQEQTADVLGRLTVLGTIVLPMNIITGLWGMNVLVPGQDKGDLNWFWAITGGLLCFGLLCYFVAKRVYGIV